MTLLGILLILFTCLVAVGIEYVAMKMFAVLMKRNTSIGGTAAEEE